LNTIKAAQWIYKLFKKILKKNTVKYLLTYKMELYTEIPEKMKLIRKISIGKDYKNEAMHYSVGQEVYGGHTISYNRRRR
jgi:hypothetical protein